MSEVVKDFFLGMPVGMYIILILAFALLCVSFVVPPLGVISSSSLQGASIILGFTWLFYVTTHIPQIVQSGAKVSASIGNAQISIGRNKKKASAKEEKQEDGEVQD